MVHWLAKATEALRRAPPPEPQPYEVACVCTHRISGMRLPAFQVVRCNRCGNYVFVLPQDVYPKPKPKKKAPPKAIATPPETGRDAGSPPPLSTGSPPPLAGASSLGVSRRSPPASRPVGADVAASPASAATPATASAVSSGSASEIRIEAVETLPTVRGPFFTPVRLVGCGILAVVVLTGYFVWRSQLKEKAALTLRAHLDAGEAALRAGKFEEAATEYHQAAEAVDILGRDDAESRMVRQKAKELNAIAHLSPLSLYELCEEARVAVTSGDASWNERFDRLYRERWIVIDGDVVSDAGPDGVMQPLIRYPFQIEGAPVILDARLKALEPGSAVVAPQHVIFAGQLVSFTEEGTKSKVWALRLRDSTAFLWAGTDTYHALGLGPDALRSEDETAHLLASQAEIVGVKP